MITDNNIYIKMSVKSFKRKYICIYGKFKNLLVIKYNSFCIIFFLAQAGFTIYKLHLI